MNYSKGLIWLQSYITKTYHLIVSSPVAQWEGVRHTWQAIADIIPQMKCTRHSSFTIQNTYGCLKWLPPLRLPIYRWPIYFYDLFVWSRWIHNDFHLIADPPFYWLLIWNNLKGIDSPFACIALDMQHVHFLAASWGIQVCMIVNVYQSLRSADYVQGHITVSPTFCGITRASCAKANCSLHSY